MLRTEVVRARIPISLKQETSKILGELGLTMTDAINAFLSQVKLKNGIPFDLKIPNDKTVETLQKTDSGEELINSANAKEMFKKLNI